MSHSQEMFIQLTLAEQALAIKTTEYEKLKSILDEVAATLYIDHNGIILEVNDAFCQWTHYYREELIGKQYYPLISTSHSTEFIVNMWQTVAGGKVWKGMLSHRTKDHAICQLETIIVPFLDTNSNPYQYAIIQKENVKKETIKKEEKKERDYLTGLHSRESFQDIVKQALRKGRNVALLGFNIEKFTLINDMFGLDFGDLILRTVANRLKEVSDRVARITGDEFMMLFDEYESDAELNEFAHYVMKLLQKPFVIEGFQLSIHVTIGICQFPGDGKTVETLLNSCRVALRNKREAFDIPINYYSRSVDEKHLKSIQLANDIHHALVQKQLFLQYEPRVDIKTGKITGAEAFVRWEHPQWGLIDPNEFLPYAEEVGLIIPINKWALEQACLQNKQWQEKGYAPIVISVNISQRQLLHRDFLDTVKHILKKTKLSPSFLEIGLTEDVQMSHNYQTFQAIEQLKKLGVSITLNDFGNGYMNFNDLKILKVDTLKIDRSFVKNLRLDETNQMILQTLIQLGTCLDKNVVITGVETESDLQCIVKNYQVELQGYVFSKPVRAEQFEDFLVTGRFDLHGKGHLHKKVFTNRRQYFRIDLPYPLKSELMFSRMNGNGDEETIAEVLIDDIGPGGLKFFSTLELPSRTGNIVSFEIDLLEQKEKLFGKIIRTEQLANGINAYGVEFVLNEAERKDLIATLNKLSIQIKAGQYEHLNIVKENITRFLLSKVHN